MRPLFERGHFAVAAFMQDFPGLFIAKIITPGALSDCQNSQGGCRQVRLEGQGLITGEDAISPEQRHEPWQAGSGKSFSRRKLRKEPQSGQVNQRALIDSLEVLP